MCAGSSKEESVHFFLCPQKISRYTCWNLKRDLRAKDQICFCQRGNSETPQEKIRIHRKVVHSNSQREGNDWGLGWGVSNAKEGNWELRNLTRFSN